MFLIQYFYFYFYFILFFLGEMGLVWTLFWGALGLGSGVLGVWGVFGGAGGMGMGMGGCGEGL